MHVCMYICMYTDAYNMYVYTYVLRVHSHTYVRMYVCTHATEETVLLGK